MPAYVLATEEVRKLVDNTFYNDGLDLSMNEQDEFILVLKLLPAYAVHFKAGPSCGPYVSFVLRLDEDKIKEPSMVRFLLFCPFFKKCILIKYTALLTMLLICMFFNRGSRKLLRLGECWD